MKALAFDLRDVFLSPGTGWSTRKLSLSFRGIGLAWIIYVLFTYAAIFLSPVGRAEGLKSLFRYYEFFPYLTSFSPGPLPRIVWSLGIVTAISILLVTQTAVARITFEDLRNNVVYQSHEALSFSIRSAAPLLMAVIVPLILVVCVITGLIIFGWLGRIPAVGEAVIAVMSLPLFFWSLAGAGLLLLFLAALLTAPAITAATGEDTLETIVQTCSLVFKRPLTLMLYEIIAVICTVTGTALLSIVSAAASAGGLIAAGYVMKDTLSGIVTIALYRLPFVMYSRRAIGYIVDLGDRVGFDFILPLETVSPVTLVSGWIMGISFLVVGVWIVSYGFSIVQSAQVLIYLALRKQIHGDDLRMKTQITDFIDKKPEK